MVKVFVGIGSNIDREKNIKGGLQALMERFGKLALSPLYLCKSVGFEGDDFYNMVASFITSYDIDEVIAELKKIEYGSGRDYKETRFSPRALDIDLLLYGDIVDADHDVPRKDITEYAFVLKPMQDMVPGLIHPITGQTVADMWRSFPKEGIELREIHSGVV